jgi:hypothetical protein
MCEFFHNIIGLQLSSTRWTWAPEQDSNLHAYPIRSGAHLPVPVKLAVSGIPALLLICSLFFVSVDSCLGLIQWLELGKGIVHIHLLKMGYAKPVINAPFLEVGVAVELLSISYYHVELVYGSQHPLQWAPAQESNLCPAPSRGWLPLYHGEHL